MIGYHEKRKSSETLINEAAHQYLRPQVRYTVEPRKMDRVLVALFLMAAIQVFTVVKLIEARHEVRVLAGEVTMHDEMLETVGDAVTVLEGGK